MRPSSRLARALALPALAILQGCGGGGGSDGGTGPGPGPRPATPDSITLTIATSLAAFPSYTPLAIASVRLVGVDAQGQRTTLGERQVPVGGTSQLQPSTLTPRMLLPTGAPATGALEVELLGAGTPARVEWSARSGTFALARDANVTQSLTFGRGSLLAIGATGVKASIAQGLELSIGDTATVSAAGTGLGAPAIIESIDTTVARMEGDRVVRAVRAGAARIVAAAGLSADTVTLQVMPLPSRIGMSTFNAVVGSIGGTLELTATPYRPDGSVARNVTLQWRSDDTTILKPAGPGRFTGLREGFAHAIAWIPGTSIEGVSLVLVQQRPGRITLTPGSGTLPVNGAPQPVIEASAVDSLGTPIARALLYQWTVTGPATITQEASTSSRARLAVTGNGIGPVTVTATWGSGPTQRSGISTWQVVPDIYLVTLGLPFTLGVGATRQLTVEGLAIGTSTRYPLPARWSSSNPAAATVDSTGMLTGVGAGDTRITASSDLFHFTTTLDVFVRVPPASIEVSAGNAQSGMPGAYVAQPLAVLVRDAAGKPVSGARVVWSEQGNTFSPATTVTSTAGVAEQRWLLNGRARTAFAKAAVEGSSLSTTFTALVDGANVGPVIISQQPPPEVTTGTRITPGVRVVLADNAGRAINYGGGTVTAEVATGDATLTGTTSLVADASGTARFDDLVLTGKPGTIVTLRIRSPEGHYTNTTGITLR